MKKLVFLIFVIISTLTYANKGNYDVSKYRQDVLNYAMAQVGKTYSQANRMGTNSFDCSSFVDRASHAAGMNSVTGANTKNWANTTASMRAGAKASKISTNQIKPGDAILFNGHVVYAIGTANGCRIDVVHASNSKPYPQGGVKVSKGYNICTAHGGYVGIITAEQVLINNGYTPVNSDGSVAVPPAGSAVGTGASTGNGTGNGVSSASTNSSLLIDWDGIQNQIVSMIDEGIEKMTPGLLILLSILTVIEISWVLFSYIVKNSVENLLLALIRIAIRFSVLAYFIPNATSVINMGYEIFSGIGSYFIKDGGGVITLNSMWAVAGRESGKILKIINESNFNWWNVVWNQAQFFEDLSKMLLLLGIIVLIYYFIVRILFEMMMAILQFRLALGLSWFFLPFDVNSVTKRDLGGKTLSTFFLTGTRIVVVMTLSGIVFKNLDVTGFGEVTFQELKFEPIFLYITVGIVMAFVMNKISDITTTLAKGS